MTTKRIARIRSLEREAEQQEERADACHWLAAELVVEELDAGTSQRQLAGDIGKSVTWVQQAARAWRSHGARPGSARPSWREALTGETAAEHAKATRTSIPKDHEERLEVARKLLKDRTVADTIRAEIYEQRPSSTDRTFDDADRKERVASAANQIRSTFPTRGETIATELLDLADQIRRGGFTDEERTAIRTAADHVVTALLEEAAR